VPWTPNQNALGTREGGNKRCFCLYVCLSVAYVANSSRTQRSSAPKFGIKEGSQPLMRIAYQSKIRVIRPINADIIYHAPYLPNGKAYELQTWCTDGGRRPASATVAMTCKVKCQGHKVTWSVWAVLAQWPINRKWIVLISTKLAGGFPTTRATLHTSFKVTGRLTQTHKMCHIFRTVRPKKLQSWCADGGRKSASAASAMTFKVKNQGHKLTSSLPILNSGNKMLYLCH